MSGQIYDSAKEYRKDKATKRRKRQALRETPKATPESEGSDSQEEDTEQLDDPEEQTHPPFVNRSKGKQRAGQKETKKGRRKDDRKDMYKAFDGSALLCIGVLFSIPV